MYICNDCGATFEYNEIHWVTEGYGERFAYCPCCNYGDFEEAKYCKVCGEPFCEDDLTEGYCLDCLNNKLTFDVFKDFALDGCRDTEVSIFEEFMFQYCYGLEYEEHPRGSSVELKDLLIKDYIDRSKSNKDFVLLDNIRIFMNGYIQEFAEYLTTKEVKGCTNQKGEQNTSA